MEKTKLYKTILKRLKSKRLYRIAFIGDSISSGEWVFPNYRATFEYILKNSFTEFSGDDWWIPSWNIKFYNYAEDGGTTRDFLSAVKLAYKEVKPDLYIVMGTSNDVELGISKEEHFKNLIALQMYILNRTGLLLFSPDIYSHDDKLNKTYLEYFEPVLKALRKDRTIVVNGYSISSTYPLNKILTLELDPIERKPDLPINDPIHPNALGNIYIAKMLLEHAFGIEVNPEKFLTNIRSDRIKSCGWN